MIVRETFSSFILVTQHDHAEISGQLAEHWKKELLSDLSKREDFLYGVYQHDKCWIDLDSSPFWNDEINAPYSFIDFPLVPRLVHYKHGIDTIEDENPYAALLCSMHYCALIGRNPEKAKWFLINERERQQKLKKLTGINSYEKKESIKTQLNILQFCDHLSIYLCNSEPGVPTKAAMNRSELLPFTNGNKIVAKWVSKSQLTVTNFPFEQNFEIKIKYKEIKKDDINKNGLVKTYENEMMKEHLVNIIMC
ncbi:DUF3891 family protein [Anaerobacillus sp. MEB173]|uniref:DUF3891 family protein n=1 Tax=Anaerobacillus sp. MEB173 TaxID=3383345 RepID=UPI003F92BB7B